MKKKKKYTKLDNLHQKLLGDNALLRTCIFQSLISDKNNKDKVEDTHRLLRHFENEVFPKLEKRIKKKISKISS